VSALRLPDFIIGGAPRSGTTWLYSLAARHPEIEMAKPVVPEPKFFLRDDLYEKGLSYYSRTWFAFIPQDKHAGEKSTNYLESAVAAERIRRCLPAVRLVFILRNPIDRAFSNYLWSRQSGLQAADFETALAQEDARERDMPQALRYSRPHALFSRGLYAELLRPYFLRFPREQILVLRFEDILVAPEGVAERFHCFLGIAPRPSDGTKLRRVNGSKESNIAKMNETTRETLRSRYREPNQQLARLLGLGSAGWWD